MSKNTVQLTGSLMTVAADMNLRAGMRVVVVNGVVLSIYSGDTAVPLSATTPGRVDDTAPPRVHRVKDIPSHIRKDGSPLTTVSPYVEFVRKMLAAGEPLTRRSIAQSMTTDTHLDGQRWKVSAAIKYLVKQGEITVESKSPDARIVSIPRHDDAPTTS